MSEPDNELLEALAALMGQGSEHRDGQSSSKTDVPPATDEFLERLAACERTVNA